VDHVVDSEITLRFDIELEYLTEICYRMLSSASIISVSGNPLSFEGTARHGHKDEKFS